MSAQAAQSLPRNARHQAGTPCDGNVMPKSIMQIRSLARGHTRTALNVLVGIMRNANATAPARISGDPILAQANQVTTDYCQRCPYGNRRRVDSHGAGGVIRYRKERE